MTEKRGRGRPPKKLVGQAELSQDEAKALFKKQVDHWKRNPIDFARQVFGLIPTNQQTRLFMEVGRIISAKMKRDEGKKVTPTEMEYVRKRGVSVRSGKGTGKGTAAAILAYWFLFCFHMSKTYLVAPSMDNLKSNLLAEMALWKSRRDHKGNVVCKLAGEFDLLTTGCRMVQDEDKGKNWFVKCNSAGPNMPEDQQVEVLQGKHARYMMFIIDEASGVPDPVFQPLDTTLTDPANFILLFFNPTRRTGFAYRTHFDPEEKKFWSILHWSAEKSDMVTPDQIEYLREKYGADSNEYRVSVLGEPPAMDDGSLIPYEWCNEAVNIEFTEQEKDPVVMGVDVARKGKDKSVILVRKGPRVLEIQELNDLDTVALSRWVAMRAADWMPQAIFVDSVGLGIGVVDELNRQGIENVYPVNVARASNNPRKFSLLRDELWWKLREKFERGVLSLSECEDRDLISELSSIKYDVKDNGKIKVESKLEMRKRSMPSPNKADALMLTMMVDDNALRVDEDEEELDRYRRREVSYSDTLSWMEV